MISDRIKAGLAIAAAIAAVLSAVTAIAQLLDYLSSGKANLVLGGSVVTIVGAFVVVALVLAFGGPVPLSAWTWFHYLVVASLAVVALAGILITVLVAQPVPPAGPDAPRETTVTAPPVTTPPVTTPSRPPGQVDWTQPTAQTPPIDPNQRVTLEGVVSDVPDDHSVWIVSKPFAQDTDYFVVQGSALKVESNGRFIAVDQEVGDTDDSGQGFTYTVVDADEPCAARLTAAGTDQVHRLGADLPPTCRPLEPTARIRIR